MIRQYIKDYKSYLNECIYYFSNLKSDAVLQSGSNAISKSVSESVDFTLRNVEYLIYLLPNRDTLYLKGKSLLEIGPGQDFGISLILADLGLEKIILIDPYLIPWNETFHSEFYKTLLIELEKRYPTIEFTSIKEVVENQSHEAAKLTTFKVGLEMALEIQDNSIDISISNACFEHFVYPELAVKELARITKVGGVGFHQIDLRDHRDYSKPLEFLTFSKNLFFKIIKITNANFGNRLRYTEYTEIFQNESFSVVFQPDSFVDEAYLKDVLRRVSPYYRGMSRDALMALGGRFLLKKVKK